MTVPTPAEARFKSLPVTRPLREDPLGETLDFMARVYNYNHWVARTLEPFVGPRVLEVGCGTGNILQFFVLRQNVMGLDPSEEYLQFCRKRFEGHTNCRFQLGDLSGDGALPQEPVDSVLCLNVLEHIEDDRKALRRIWSLLPPGGNLVLLVPAHQILYSSLDRVIGHFRRYGKADLLGKIREAGFEVETCFRFNLVGFFGWFLNGRILGRTALPVHQTKLYDRHIVPLQSYAESLISPPLGQSLIVVARKS